MQWVSWCKQKAMSFNNVAIASVKENDYRNHFWYISKIEAIKIMENSDLSTKKVGHY